MHAKQYLNVWINGFSGRMGREIQSYIEEANSELQQAFGNELKLLGGCSSRSLITMPNKSNAAAIEYEYEPSKEIDYLNQADVVFDFSNQKGNQRLISSLKKISNDKRRDVLIGSTGLSENDLSPWYELIGKKENLFVLLAPNTSVGILVMSKLASIASKLLEKEGFDIELHETHHRGKVDVPSGTALHLAETLSQELNKHCVYGRQGKRQTSEIGISATRGGAVFGTHTLSLLGDYEQLSIRHEATSRTLFAKGALTLVRWLHLRKKADFYKLTDIDLSDLY